MNHSSFCFPTDRMDAAFCQFDWSIFIHHINGLHLLRKLSRKGSKFASPNFPNSNDWECLSLTFIGDAALSLLCGKMCQRTVMCFHYVPTYRHRFHHHFHVRIIFSWTFPHSEIDRNKNGEKANSSHRKWLWSLMRHYGKRMLALSLFRHPSIRHVRKFAVAFIGRIDLMRMLWNAQMCTMLVEYSHAIENAGLNAIEISTWLRENGRNCLRAVKLWAATRKWLEKWHATCEWHDSPLFLRFSASLGRILHH